MSTAIASTHNTIGLRNLGRTSHGRIFSQSRPHLNGYLTLGSAPDPDTVGALTSAGYDPALIQTAIALGATDEQLLALPYPADENERAAAMQQLIGQLQGIVPAPGQAVITAPNAGTTQAASQWTVSTAFGVYDMTQEASWNAINNIFSGTRNDLNAAATKFPGDPDVISHIQQFNSLVMQWAGYYQQAFGSAPNPIPLASTGTLSGTLGVFPIAIAIVAAAFIVGALATVYAIKQWAAVKLAQQGTVTQATSASTSAANSLLQQASNAQAQGNSSLAAQLRAQAQQLLNQASTTASPVSAASVNSFFSQYGIWILLIAGGAIVLPPLIKKL